MSAEYKKSTGATLVLILLGLAALVSGARWLTVLIPVALLVWYVANPTLRSGRN